MALTTETTLTNTWVAIVPDGTDFVLQNNGLEDIFLFWKATAPALTDIGFKIKPGNGGATNPFLNGKVWAKCPKRTSSVAVNV